MKYAAERALKHLCEGMTAAEAAGGVKPGQSNAITTYIATNTASSSSVSDRETAVVLRDYMRKVLLSLPADSDDEGFD